MAPTTIREDDIRARILAVDDEVLNLELLERSLRKNYDVMTASSPMRALELLADEPDVAVILSDYRMPGMTGTELLSETLQSHPDTRRVIITGYADNDAVSRATDAGEVDFVIKKPWRHKQLHQLLQQFVEGYRLARENRSLSDTLRSTEHELDVRDELLATSLDEDGPDILSRQRELSHAQQELEARVFRDPVTGLYSPRAFHTRLREELARARRYERSVSLLLGEVDHFDTLIEELGMERADALLREVSRLLIINESTRVRESDVVARLEGTTFAILLVETDRSGAAIKASRLREAVARTEMADASALTLSVGIACAPDDSTDADTLLTQATHALESARRSGGNRQARYMAPGKRSDADTSLLPRIPTLDTGAFRMAHTMVSEVARGLAHGRSRAAVYIDMSPLVRLRPALGHIWHASIHERVADTLSGMLGTELAARDQICRTDDHDFVCLLAVERHPDTEPRDIESVAETVASRLAHDLAPHLPRDLRELGAASVYATTMLGPENASSADASRLLSSLVATARDAAHLRDRMRWDGYLRALARAVAGERIAALYQPIVALERAEIVAYEARARGPARTALESWRGLTIVARYALEHDQPDLVIELDRATVKRSLRSASGLAPAHKLFVNIDPRTFYNTSFMQARLEEFLTQNPLTPEHLVFCVTERDALEQFTEFRRAMPTYASKGMSLALQDIGAQASDLDALLQLEPRYLLLSPLLTQGLATSRHKRMLVRSLVALAESVGATLIARGVEHPEDPRRLLELGIRHGIGSFLARPSNPFPRLRAAVKRTLASTLQPYSPIVAPPMDAARQRSDDTRTARSSDLLPANSSGERASSQTSSQTRDQTGGSSGGNVVE